MYFVKALSYFVVVMLCASLLEAKFYRPYQYNLYKAGSSQQYDSGNPTSRHKNHCSYVVEKTVSFTVQDGTVPYVKAEYNKCSWEKKCPTLMYRLMYKPHYKVAHKTVTELEWRCCPGYSGYNCMEEPAAHHHQMNMIQSFQGPPFRGPHFNGQQHKGPMFKGPHFKGSLVKANPWSQSKGPPPGQMNSYPMRRFGPPMSPSYPETSFETYPAGPEPMPDHQHPHHPEYERERVHEQEHEHEREHESEHEIELHPGLETPVAHVPVETTPPAGSEGNEDERQPLDGETHERLNQMEEDVQRLTQGLENLRGTVSGLEEGLRASLREDANRMLSALLAAAPGPIPAPALAASHSTVGFGDIPGGHPEAWGLDGARVPPGLGELSGRVEELRAALQAKAAELLELRVAVLGHDGTLRKLSPESRGPHAEEHLMEAKLSGARVDILGGVETRVETAEARCQERLGEALGQCQRERSQGREQLEEALEESTTGLRRELGLLQAQLLALEATEGCCGSATGLEERVGLLEVSVASLNQSQGHLGAQLGTHRDHIEGVLHGRLAYVEAQLNLTGPGRSHGEEEEEEEEGSVEGEPGLEAKLEEKLRALEGRLLAAVEELGNVTAQTPPEGRGAPPAPKGRLEADVERLQEQLSSLQLLCSSSSTPPSPPPSALQGDAPGEGVLEAQAEGLASLNVTLQSLLKQLALREPRLGEGGGDSLQGELSVLRFSVRSVNRSLRGLRESLGAVTRQVGQANSSWQEREGRLAQQMRGVVQLVGHQASMLGAGDRRLGRLKAELTEMKRRLAGEVQGCRNTALGVKKEVIEVGGRVADVEDRCRGLNHVADDLERIREELERQSDGLLSQVNGTLSSHAKQLSELRGGLRNCSLSRAESGHHSPQGQRRGDTFTVV